MSIADRGQPVSVNVGACRCPGGTDTHPDGDVVWLKAELDVPMAIAASAVLDLPEKQRLMAAGELTGKEADADIQGALTGVYLRHGIVRWTFTDEKGETLPITVPNVNRLLPWGSGGQDVANTADGLYSEALFAPLVKAVVEAEKERTASLNREQRRLMKKSSRNGQTAPSTSASRNSGSTHREPSSSSSPASSAGSPSVVLTP